MPAPRATQHRVQIMDILSAGPIVDKGGLAIQKLQELTGHESTNALTKVLRQMEQHGLITREVKGRRTFRIALANDTAEPVPVPAADVDHAPQQAEPASNGNGEIDYELLGATLVNMAYRKLAADPDQMEALRRENETLRTELRHLRVLEARVADLETEVAMERARADAAERNVKVVMTQREEAKRGVDKIKDKVSPEAARELRELEKVLRSAPTRRG